MTDQDINDLEAKAKAAQKADLAQDDGCPFICDPAVVLALIASLREAREALDKFGEADSRLKTMNVTRKGGEVIGQVKATSKKEGVLAAIKAGHRGGFYLEIVEEAARPATAEGGLK
jgi:hypothetical protein